MKALPPLGATDRARDTAINQLIQGRSNATGTVSLAPDQTLTTVSKATISADARVFLFPRTQNAAIELAAGTLYVSAVENGRFTVAHASDPQGDRTFAYLVIGG